MIPLARVMYQSGVLEFTTIATAGAAALELITFSNSSGPGRAWLPGSAASAGGRFYSWVVGGSIPAALAADWLTSAWDQNAGLYAAGELVGGLFYNNYPGGSGLMAGAVFGRIAGASAGAAAA